MEDIRLYWRLMGPVQLGEIQENADEYKFQVRARVMASVYKFPGIP